jgi:hypothetical protein
LGFELGLADSPIHLRVDFPLLVGDPALAFEKRRSPAALRALVSVTGY